MDTVNKRNVRDKQEAVFTVFYQQDIKSMTIGDFLAHQKEVLHNRSYLNTFGRIHNEEASLVQALSSLLLFASEGVRKGKLKNDDLLLQWVKKDNVRLNLYKKINYITDRIGK